MSCVNMVTLAPDLYAFYFGKSFSWKCIAELLSPRPLCNKHSSSIMHKIQFLFTFSFCCFTHPSNEVYFQRKVNEDVWFARIERELCCREGVVWCCSSTWCAQRHIHCIIWNCDSVERFGVHRVLAVQLWGIVFVYFQGFARSPLTLKVTIQYYSVQKSPVSFTVRTRKGRRKEDLHKCILRIQTCKRPTEILQCNGRQMASLFISGGGRRY